jgi:hypothetical protein
MTQPRRRVRRRNTDNDNDALIDSPTESFPTSQDFDPQPQVVSSSPPAIATLPPPTQIVNDDLDPIRTELLNDFHHQNFSESDYWDESHNWSDDEDSVSDEYWHFLGLYE